MSAAPAPAPARAKSRRRGRGGGEGSTVASRKRGKRALTVYFVLFLVFLYLPSVLLILFSFNDDLLPQFPIKGLTFEWYQEAWNTQALRDSFKNPIMVATACALIAPAIALLASYPIARRNFRGRNIVTAVMLLPLVVPLLVLGIAMLILIQKGPGAHRARPVAHAARAHRHLRPLRRPAAGAAHRGHRPAAGGGRAGSGRLRARRRSAAWCCR